jgi:hypothetical protein
MAILSYRKRTILTKKTFFLINSRLEKKLIISIYFYLFCVELNRFFFKHDLKRLRTL